MKTNHTNEQLQSAALSQLRPIAEAGAVPEGCVRVRAWDGDTHFADIRLPAPAEADPYTELKKAHAEGKIIQINCCTVEQPNWVDLPSPAYFGEPHEYRIKPEPETFDPTPEPLATKPISPPTPNEAISLRDWFAGQALAGIVQAVVAASLHSSAQTPDDEVTACWALKIADAMLKAREVKP
jgi:hypothetical protein